MTYVVLINFTDKGIKQVKESPRRAAAFRTQVEAAGGTVKDVYWTLGRHDGVLVMEAPDDATATAVLLNLGAAGNVRTETLRAYDAAEFEGILAKV